jgi:putative Mg2+ transporter-C (MgtC) family protein
MEISFLEALLRIVLAVLLGGVVGYQREAHERPAGFRTHILVTLGATLIMLVSYYPFKGLPYSDPSRIASQVIVGIGFLGAGTIIRQGNIVVGLTTAASLWTMAAVGLALGLGYYSLAIVSTILILLTLTLFKLIEKKLVKKKVVSFKLETEKEKMLEDFVESGEWEVKSIKKRKEGKRYSYVLTLSLPSTVSPTSLVRELSSLEGVKEVFWESS